MGAKDWLIGKTALAMLNQSVLKPYGTLKQLSLDTERRTMVAELELIGEMEPVRLEVHSYEILDEKDAAYLVLRDVTTSRPWLTTLARNFVVDHKLKLPDAVRACLPMIA